MGKRDEYTGLKKGELDIFFGDDEYSSFDGYSRMNWVYPDQRNYTQSERPYGFSDYWVFHDSDDADDASYDDRMLGWDYELFREAKKIHAPNKDFKDCSREQLNKFASMFFRKQCTVVGLSRGCNVSNGYPYYVFYTRWEKTDEEKYS